MPIAQRIQVYQTGPIQVPGWKYPDVSQVCWSSGHREYTGVKLIHRQLLSIEHKSTFRDRKDFNLGFYRPIALDCPRVAPFPILAFHTGGQCLAGFEKMPRYVGS